MEVAYWQIFVIASVATSYGLWGKRPATIVAGGWTVWTIVAVYAAPLLIFQVGSAWATWLVANLIAAQQQRLNSLESILRAYSVERQREIRSRAENAESIVIVSGTHHYEELLAALRAAESELCILSGWIRSCVVNNNFERLASAALQRGASIWIGYGYKDGQGQRQVDKRAKRRLEALAMKARKCNWPGRLHFREFDTHEKVLTKDDQYVIYGSHNWLSNRRFRNRERSAKLMNAPAAIAERDRIIGIVAGDEASGA
ncbi:MAG TPA: hypothetical protein VF329_02390 [Gammaproteobacteria bacterium]